MKRRVRSTSILANPVIIGAVTVLVVIVAVFLSYNANNGLPFVPTTELYARVPNAQKLVKGNEVREGGFRIGVVDQITVSRLRDGQTDAKLKLKLDKKAGSIPDDSTIVIRPKSALGLKYVELDRGRSRRHLANGDTITVGGTSQSIEIEDFFGIFDPPTVRAIRQNLQYFGDGLAGRGPALNQTLETLPPFLAGIQPVARTLADPSTRLAEFFQSLDRAARVVAPVSSDFAAGFTSGADTFEAISRYPNSLREFIAKSPETLRVATRALHDQRPFFRHLAAISPDIRKTSAELRATLPTINVALRTGTPVLRRTPALSNRLRGTFAALFDLANRPSTDLALRGLTATVTTLNPTLRYLGPYITVCNYWNYFWTPLSEHMREQDANGQSERILAKSAPPQPYGLGTFGASQPVNGPPAPTGLLGDPAFAHGQPYGAAIDNQGKADCESGQRGYPRRLASKAPPNFDIALDPHTPGNQGPTYKGRARVPAGETFQRDPTQTGP